jgi:hypothetical protein
MPVSTSTFAAIKSVEPTLVRKIESKVLEIIKYPYVLYQLFQGASKDEINALQAQVPFELDPNPNFGAGAGTTATPFREPGSPEFAALYFQSVEMHHPGGIDGDTLDNLVQQGGSVSSVLGKRVGRDMKGFMWYLNRNLHRGNKGTSGTVDTTVGAVAYSAGTGLTAVFFDNAYGVKHILRGGTYDPYDPATSTLRGAGAYVCRYKIPSSQVAYFEGDLSGIGLATGDIFVQKGTYLKERDGLPEFLGASGVYAGNDRDVVYHVRGNQVDLEGDVISIGALEKGDVLMDFAGDGEYKGDKRIDIVAPNIRSQLVQLGWGDRVFSGQDKTFVAGYTAVKYKDRMLTIDKDADPTRWYSIDLTTMRRYVLREMGLYKPPGSEGFFELRGNQTIYDAVSWIWYCKGQFACVNPRNNLLYYNINIGDFGAGHV